MTKTLSVKEVADKLDTDPRTLRKFLRKEVKDAGGTIGEDTPGKGGRYAIEAKAVAGIRKRFAAFQVAEAEARAERAARKAEEAAAAAEAEDDEDLEDETEESEDDEESDED